VAISSLYHAANAVAHERFEETGNTPRERRRVREHFEHVGDAAALFEQLVVNRADSRPYFVTLEKSP
jgi:hypothetical protein